MFEDLLLCLEELWWIHIELRIRRLVCFFLGHNRQVENLSGFIGGPYKYWCTRCLMEDPPELYEWICVPAILHHLYVWVCKLFGVEI